MIQHYCATGRAERIEHSAYRKFMKVKGKVWVDSYGAEIILFIKISDLINN